MKYVAIMDTESMTWVGMGNTENEAKKAIQKKWNDHPVRETMTVKRLESYYGITVIEINDGECVCW